MKSQLELKSREGKDIVITTSWDDFTRLDVRLSQLLIEYGIPAIFYIPSNKLHDVALLALARELSKHPTFDIGSHTVSHALLTRISKDRVWCELADSKRIIEEFLNIPIKHFCYPRGYYDEDVAQLVQDAGYLTARTVKVLSTDIVQDPFALQTTIHAYNRKEYGGRTWSEVGVELFDYVMQNGGYFHLWGHSAEVDKHGDWAELEWMLSYMNEGIKKLRHD